MDLTLAIQYMWTLVVLVMLEGILAADNACVLAVMIKHLPEDLRKKALFYGLAGAFVFRFASLFAISYLVDMWQVQAVGAIYLMFICINHLIKTAQHPCGSSVKSTDGLWTTVLKVELADIAFAADSILAAVALALTLPATPIPPIGGLDGGKFLLVFTGGFIGLVIMRFAAQWFAELLLKKPALETSAFLIVGWVGVKLAVYTFAHPAIGVLSQEFASSLLWKAIFWGVFCLIIAAGFFPKKTKNYVDPSI